MKSTMKLSIFLPMAAVLTLGATAVYAEDSVKMTFSGTSESSANNLQISNTHMDEDVFVGTGTLGSFSLRNVRAISTLLTPTSACPLPNKLHSTEPAAAGIFRFVDGSLLYVQVTQGDDCIDLVANDAHCTLIFQITGGTGRFKNASGTLTLTETAVPVLADSSSIPVYFAVTGKITGTVDGVSEEHGPGHEQ
jgi:hypothetical protein